MASTYNMPSGSVVEIGIVGAMFNQRILNVLHYRYVAPTPASDGEAKILTFLNAFSDDAIQKFRACLSSDYKLERLTGQMIFSQRYAKTELLINEDGLIADSGQTCALAGVITKRSIYGEKGGTGSLHIGGMPGSAFSGGLVTPAATALLEQYADALQPGIVLSSSEYLVPILYRRKAPTNNRDWVAHAIQPQARTMSRRVVGRGI